MELMKVYILMVHILQQPLHRRNMAIATVMPPGEWKREFEQKCGELQRQERILVDKWYDLGEKFEIDPKEVYRMEREKLLYGLADLRLEKHQCEERLKALETSSKEQNQEI